MVEVGIVLSFVKLCVPLCVRYFVKMIVCQFAKLNVNQDARELVRQRQEYNRVLGFVKLLAVRHVRVKMLVKMLAPVHVLTRAQKLVHWNVRRHVQLGAHQDVRLHILVRYRVRNLVCKPVQNYVQSLPKIVGLDVRLHGREFHN